MRRALHLVLLLSCAAAMAAQSTEKVNQDSLVLKVFSRRVGDYVRLLKTVQPEIHRLKPTNSPEAIERYEHHLAHHIRETRRHAIQGDIFTPEISAEFRRLIGTAMQGPDAARIRQSLQHAAPVYSRDIRVNSSYPASLPLQSTPPSLLLNLPPLPPKVEYRVVGHDLILRDIDANLVVDAIPNAIP